MSPFFRHRQYRVSCQEPKKVNYLRLCIQRSRLLREDRSPLPRFIRRRAIHLQPSSFRASEERRYLCIASNTRMQIDIQDTRLHRRELPHSFPSARTRSGGRHENVYSSSANTSPYHTARCQRSRRRRNLSQAKGTVSRVTIRDTVRQPGNAQRSHPGTKDLFQ